MSANNYKMAKQLKRETARISMKATLYKALLRFVKKDRSNVSRTGRIAIEEYLKSKGERINDTDND